MPATIILVDDHPIFRQGLSNLLAKEKDLTVVGEAEDGQMAIELVCKKLPDLVVMDINMPNLDGIEATRQILSECPDTKVVALSVHSSKQFVRDMFKAGASGYILKESIPEEMVEGIHQVLAGMVYLSKSISKTLISDYRTLLSSPHPDPHEPYTTILFTKLYPPPISADVIPRARLIEHLENGRGNSITLIAAPAGYGKSILASQWLEVSELPGAWVSLDKGDNDLRVFLIYLLETIQNLFPDQELTLKSLLGSAKLPSLEVAARYLLNDFETISKRFILVLDDYHHIRQSEIHDFLINLLAHPSPNMHLVLISRRDPSLPLTSLRSRGMMTEVTAKDIRFTVSETKLYLERFLRMNIMDKTAEVLEEKVEGWVTGLHLAALSIKNANDQELLTDGLMETSQYVRDYLVQEVLSKVPPQFNPYILQAAILDRFCASLFDALSLDGPEGNSMEANTTGQDFIDWVIQANLFIISLDTAKRWYRFHHLFQELLQGQLGRTYSKEEIAALHKAASRWFAGNDLIEEAVQHGRASGDLISAARLVEKNREAALNADRRFDLEKWLSVLPNHLILERPGLLLARAWVLYSHFELTKIPPVIDAAEKLLKDVKGHQSITGEIHFFRGFFYYFQNKGKLSLKHLDKARELVPETSHEICGQIEMFYGLTRQMLGKKDDALATLDDLLIHPLWVRGIAMARFLSTKVFIYIISGELEQAAAENKQLYDLASKDNYASARAWGVYLKGLILFYQNDVEAAIDFFIQAIDGKYIRQTRVSVDSMAGLALAYQANGDMDKAAATIKRLREFCDTTHDPVSALIARSCHARVSIMLGDQKPVTDFVREDTFPVENMVWWIETPAKTYCRALLAEGSDLSLKDAEARLQKLLELNQANHNVLQSVSTLSLLAVTFQKQGRDDEALQTVEQALHLTNSTSIIQPYVELGPPMADLLKQLAGKNIAVQYIGKILEAFSDSEAVLSPPSPRLHAETASSQVSPVAPESRPHPLVDPLTNRELDVLELLAQRFQNKEIAKKLYISSETIKGHLKNIYQKLGVSSRRQAVEKAKELGML